MIDDDSEGDSEGNKEIIPSPCIRQCCLDPDDVCLGCGRTLDEILQWSSMSNAEKLSVLKRVEGK